MGRRAAEGGPAGGSPGRRNSRSAALLAASILSSCFLLAQTQNIPIKVLPAQPRKGETVTLIPGGKTDYDTCTWYRGEEAEMHRIFTYMPTSLLPQQNGPEFTGRETAGPGCSLTIRNLDVSDSEIYTVSRLASSGQETGRVKITVPGSHGFGLRTVGKIVAWAVPGTVLIGGLIFYTVYRRRQVDQMVMMSSVPASVATEGGKV